MTIQAFFDESGKFGNQPSICFGGVASPYQNIDPFIQEWDQLLRNAELEALSMKDALRLNVPFSQTIPAMSVQERIDVIMPFVECIRKHMMFVSGLALKGSAFESAAPSFKKTWGDPIYFAFTGAILEFMKYAKNDIVILTCDENPATAMQMYQLYTRLKQVDPAARNQLKQIAFGDDNFVPALQAADVVASLMRSEARQRFFNEPYDHEPLFNALTKQPNSPEAIVIAATAFVDEPIIERCTLKVASGV
jgi:hypothetical protein